ncbi:S-layer homology domain-containing protein [Paenibacillus hamazuiensis]|uniref:S-layer homology domain-containing protein n=1 Tax=Paenibacillus hamazuiensis TaxID=2936508 RepID=UPI00200E187F|nr:S-layer homology domain-containing protein [Paenibacillus hamazuiensis]
MCYSRSFDDLEKHWTKDAWNDMKARTLIEGEGDGRFEPDRDIIRVDLWRSSPGWLY